MGQDVIPSAIIAAVMAVRGVDSATFVVPSPSTQKISVASNEKAVILASNISLT